MKIYISLAMTGAPDSFISYWRAISRRLEMAGHDVYFPPDHFAVEEEAKPLDVFHGDMDALRDSEVIIADVSRASIGVGVELQSAFENGKTVIVAHRPAQRVSRIVLGLVQYCGGWRVWKTSHYKTALRLLSILERFLP